ncbi:hypothetical protein SAMN06297144_2559 [Sphingomonas guangdongensis]|uniref:Uncharacterized protein n=1 Tax=Sphingomonas guangdongensis TaxID=1141890 RepID=A0A285R4Z9_9SPHN|nr:hypothetical protein [Sphingomonas guangdongensis]SOB87427.1 hypothetical protein SAMN06297144_2559 [Sphingomonas guangdongensis]
MIVLAVSLLLTGAVTLISALDAVPIWSPGFLTIAVACGVLSLMTAPAGTAVGAIILKWRRSRNTEY